MTATTTDHSHLHARHRERGVNPLVYWLVRALFQPFFHLYFRLSRIGREHVPDPQRADAAGRVRPRAIGDGHRR